MFYSLNGLQPITCIYYYHEDSQFSVGFFFSNFRFSLITINDQYRVEQSVIFAPRLPLIKYTLKALIKQ